jgi:hypothetical protein
MSKMLIMQSQKNDIFNLIKAINLDPSGFVWGEIESELTEYDTGNPWISKLTHTETEYFFAFEFRYDDHVAVMSPGEAKIVEYRNVGDWDHQVAAALDWLEYLRREITAPDYWAQISEYQSLAQSSNRFEGTNTPFTSREVHMLNEGLNEMKSLFKEYAQQENDEFEMIDARFDDVIGLVEEMGRNSWLHTAIGAVITVSMSLGLSPDIAKEIWEVFRMKVAEFIILLP